MAGRVGGVPAPARMVVEAPAVRIEEAPPVRLVRTAPERGIRPIDAPHVRADSNDVPGRGDRPSDLDARNCRRSAGRLGQGQSRRAKRHGDGDDAKILHAYSPCTRWERAAATLKAPNAAAEKTLCRSGLDAPLFALFALFAVL